MPSTTEKQREFMGADLSRLRAGKKTRTGMTAQQLRDFASKPLAKKAKGGEIDDHPPRRPTMEPPVKGTAPGYHDGGCVVADYARGYRRV